jgi:Recombination endonuclease VII
VTPDETRAYQREWRSRHPHYGRDLLRNGPSIRPAQAAAREAAETAKAARREEARRHPRPLRPQGVRGKIGLEAVRSLHRLQSGRCALCLTAAPAFGHSDGLHLDHDHETGEVRGLICRTCNQALRALERSGGTWMLRVLAYLGDPPARRLGLARIPEPILKVG